MNQLKDIRHLILDMDGVLWEGSTPLVDLPHFFGELQRKGIEYVCATNNASKTTAEYVEKFAGLGVEMESWRILNSAETTASYLAQHYPPGTRVCILGGNGVYSALVAHQFDVINQPGEVKWGEPSAELVVVGLYTNATYNDFAQAGWHIRHGARFIGCNGDISFPHELGLLPGAGAFLAFLEASTGVAPTIIGKPNHYIFHESLRRLRANPSNTAMVGDRLATDIVGGQALGMPTVLVLSGVTNRQQLAESGLEPTWVMQDVAELAQRLEESPQP